MLSESFYLKLATTCKNLFLSLVVVRLVIFITTLLPSLNTLSLGWTNWRSRKFLEILFSAFDKTFLDKFAYIPVIEIDLRFLDCNCEIKWVLEWRESDLWQYIVWIRIHFRINQKCLRALNFDCRNMNKCSGTHWWENYNALWSIFMACIAVLLQDVQKNTYCPKTALVK